MLCDDICAAMKVIAHLFVVMEFEYMHCDEITESKDSLKILARTHAGILKDYSDLLDNDGAIEETDQNEPKKGARKSKFYRRLERLHIDVQQKLGQPDTNSE